WVQKTAGKTTAAIGDFVPYQIDVTNGHPSATAFGTIVTDNLPLGFRYRRGSSTIKGTAAPDPQISSDGRTLTYTVGDILPGATGSVKLVVEVAAGAKPGVATNYASARSLSTTSNTAQAAVQVQSDFLNSRSILMGRVGRGPCDLDWDEGVEGVRIYLEDGTFVVTDKHGMYHFEGVRPGTHVVQLDLDSLREGFEVYSCEENTRFAGRSFSQFVDLQGGSMWRVDFRAGKPDDALLYRKRIEERLAAEKAAAEKVRKEAEAARLAAEAKKKAAEAPEKVVEQEEEYPKNDWAPAPPPPKKEEADEEIPADDWATPPPQHPSTEKTAVTVSEAAPAVVQGAEAPTGVGTASLELQSALEQGKVVLTPTVTVPNPSPASQRLEVELPTGVVYTAGSATRDGSPTPDPQIAAGKLTFTLDHAAAGTSINLRFAADFSADAPSGEYITRAVFIHSDAKGPDRRTPYADNVIVRIREEERSKLPAMTLRPHFKTFSTELAPEELAVLDEAVRQINGYKVRQILLVGHTDNVPIAARSRDIHRDNTALSAGRALSVARYLKERLRLTPAQISASGKGESVPVAGNKTAERRALNRRVEVVILTERVTERMKTRLHKEKSGVV
ncbi:MAG TPA: OmpA family protein, partial [Geobacteraceae bacterium]|nr:OmpA family protein [Geobacteraceae bacterium]